MLVSSDALIGCPARTLTLFAGCLQFIWSRSVDVPAPIEAVAVWDTVASYGIPTYNANLVRIDFFRFADLKLCAPVRNGLHALAVDEQREDFEPHARS
jgi:hypothetical protein